MASNPVELPHDSARSPSGVHEMPIGSQTEVEIHIKSPSFNNEDFTIKMNLSDSVVALKQQISVEVPLHPTIEEQRLVYSGKLLKNEELLSEVFRNVR
jgi:hypothetical protein